MKMFKTVLAALVLNVSLIGCQSAPFRHVTILQCSTFRITEDSTVDGCVNNDSTADVNMSFVIWKQTTKKTIITSKDNLLVLTPNQDECQLYTNNGILSIVLGKCSDLK